jgi:hypothetical protein
VDAVAAIVVAGSLHALWWIIRERPESATPMPTPATNAAVSSHRPVRQAIDLPALDASDEAVRQLAAFLARNPLLARMLATKDLVRTFALIVQEISDGKTPADPLLPLRPTTRLTLAGGDTTHLDPASYARWQAATHALTSIEPKDAAQLYVNIKLLLDDAYRDLGHPNANFDEGLVSAMQMLFSTPRPTGDPEITRRPNYFEHTDTTLRGLRPVQKQYLLIGPDNRRQIEAWLRAFAAELELKIGS